MGTTGGTSDGEEAAAALTTADRVYHRAGLSTKDLASSQVDEFIGDAQAFIEATTKCIFAASDSNYNLARSACTDLAASIAARQQSKLELANKLLARANQAISMLEPKVTLKARSTTS